jgi:hypothetical protein
MPQEQLGFLQQEDYTCRDGSGQQVRMAGWCLNASCGCLHRVCLHSYGKLCWLLLLLLLPNVVEYMRPCLLDVLEDYSCRDGSG